MKFYFLYKRGLFSSISFHHDQGNGYDSHDEKIFANMLCKAKNNEQIIIHLTENRDIIYYLYSRIIGTGLLAIGIKNSEVCNNFNLLFEIYEGIINKLLIWPQPIVIQRILPNKGLKFTKSDFKKENEEIMLFKSTYDYLVDKAFNSSIRLSAIPPTGSSTNPKHKPIERYLDEVGSEHIVELIKKGCYNIIINKKKKYDCLQGNIINKRIDWHLALLWIKLVLFVVLGCFNILSCHLKPGFYSLFSCCLTTIGCICFLISEKFNKKINDRVIVCGYVLVCIATIFAVLAYLDSSSIELNESNASFKTVNREALEQHSETISTSVPSEFVLIPSGVLKNTKIKDIGGGDYYIVMLLWIVFIFQNMS